MMHDLLGYASALEGLGVIDSGELNEGNSSKMMAGIRS